MPVAKDGEIYKVRQGKNKGKFSIRMPKEDKRSIYKTRREAKKHKRDYFNDPANKRGKPGPRKVDAPTGFVTGEEMLKAAREKNIFVSAGRDPSNFATVFKFPKKMVKRKNFYDISKLNIQDEIDKILKAQVKSGSATDFAKEKFPIKTIYESQEPRQKNIKQKGGVKKGSPIIGKRKLKVDLGHAGNIFSKNKNEIITLDKLTYTPSQINEIIGQKGGIDDKIRAIEKSQEKVIKNLDDAEAAKYMDRNNIPYNKAAGRYKRQLLNASDETLTRLVFQSGGYKVARLSSGVDFGKGFLKNIPDPFGLFEGMTEREFVDFRRQYITDEGNLQRSLLNKDANKKRLKVNLAKTKDFSKVIKQNLPEKELRNLINLKIMEENRLKQLKTASQTPSREIKQIIATLSVDPRCKTKGFLNQGGRVGFQDGSASLDVCFKGGIDNINRGLPNPTAAQAKNFGRVAAFGRNVVKLGILPEALFLAGESVIRMGMGDTLPESILRASEYLLPGNQTIFLVKQKLNKKTPYKNK